MPPERHPAPHPGKADPRAERASARKAGPCSREWPPRRARRQATRGLWDPHSSSGAARLAPDMNRRARHRTVGTEHAAIACFRMLDRVAHDRYTVPERPRPWLGALVPAGGTDRDVTRSSKAMAGP